MEEITLNEESVMFIDMFFAMATDLFMWFSVILGVYFVCLLLIMLVVKIMDWITHDY